MHNINIRSGICESIMRLFRIKEMQMSTQEKMCAIVFEEMSLKHGIKYDQTNDEVEGFEDFGATGGSKLHADHTLVFMVRGLSTNWKQPIPDVLSRGPTKSAILQSVIHNIKQIGLTPKIVICDQGTNNRSIMKRLGVTTAQPFFHLEGLKIFAMFDPPHLIKNIRNNLKRNRFLFNDRIVSWQFFDKFYDMDSTLPICMAPKLTKRHISMSAFAHLRVSLAV
ncbi:uncharacterized protein LOC101846722 isoform X1 [Aplysia californica]|uniref:Uncharacterized protein LOC101846722 isoform X1 n=1 Tax=Aplysia californica TaxID=6500 RepID=A0ABM1VPJ4_APLCA|nr:uncharacterized protein LOC101846722 isoform X1 [Aplysia californica]